MRLFNVKTDQAEIYKIQNALIRLKLMRKLGTYDATDFYGKKSNWLYHSYVMLVNRYENRLKELQHAS